MLKVTTSWDDGDILDNKLADLLKKYGVKGTFYVTKNYRSDRLSETDIKNISEFHEIGAHTLTHPDLRTLNADKMKEEIDGSKRWLEEVLGKQIKMFCYPKGLFNETAVSVTKAFRFLGARTTNLGSMEMPNDAFLMNTTLQVYPFPFRKIDSKKYYVGKLIQPLIQRAPKLIANGVSIFSMNSWLNTAKATFDTAFKKEGVFHLWGHSWEIEKYGMWEDLEKLLQYISNKQSCKYVTNSELITIT